MNGPKRPLFTTRPLSHVGHFSLCSCDRSCTSWISFWTSTASSALANGPQKSPSTCCQARSPSSTLSSSSSIWAVKPTLNTSGNERFITCHTVSPNGVGANRRSLAVAYQRILRVEMMLAYVDGRPIPRRSRDRKSIRLNSSHVSISYAVFCLKKKNKDELAKWRYLTDADGEVRYLVVVGNRVRIIIVLWIAFNGYE